MNPNELREASIEQAAYHYCAAGLAIVPLIGKRPAYGDDWWARAILDPEDALVEFSSDSRYTNIGWCQGYGTVAVDVDEPELLPAEVRDVIHPGALNLTRRNPDRGHRIFTTYQSWSASTARFPERGWGEVRARGGQIVIWGPHPVTDGFYLYDVEQTIPQIPHELVEWLTPAGDYEAAANDRQVSDFLDGHKSLRTDSKESPTGIAKWLHEQEAAGVGLHELVVSALVWGFREARQGHYPAAVALEVVQQWWTEAWRRRADDTTGARTAPSRGEWEGAMRWAVGQAMTVEDGTQPEREDPDPSDWEPANIGALLDGELEPSPTPHYLKASDEGVGLFYAGSINCLFGDSGSGKSWIAAKVAAEALEAGDVVLWIDLEQTLMQTVERMVAVGTGRDALRDHFLRIAPRDDIRADVKRATDLVDTHGVQLVVLDSLGEAFGIDGVNENNDDEVGPWQRDVLRVLTDLTTAKPAILVIDHATKAKEAPLFPSGSKRKRAGWTGAGYLVESSGFSKDEPGWVDLKVAKDRHGARPAGQLALKLHMQPRGEYLDIEPVQPPPEDTEPVESYEDDRERRQMVRDLVVRIEAHLTAEGLTELTTRQIRELAPWRNATTAAVLDLAHQHAFLDRQTGDRGAHLWAVDQEPTMEWVLGVDPSLGERGL